MSCHANYFFDDSISLNQKCQTAKMICQDSSFINYYEFIYCDLDGSWGIFILIFCFTILIVFRIMKLVVENYLTPSIEYMTTKLNVSQSLSAVTFLALANGAGDVITAIVASESIDGVQYNIGALYGAGFFVSTLVIGITIINSKSFIQMKSSFIWRDILFYIISTFVIIIYGIIGRFTIWDSCLLLFLYIILVLIVIIQDTISLRKKKNVNEQLIDEFDLDETQISTNYVEYQEYQITNTTSNWIDKIFCIIDIPFDYILKISIPPTKEYSRILCTYSYIPSLCFAYFILGEDKYNIYQYIYMISIGFILGLITYSSTSDNNQIPSFYLLIQCYSTLISLIWIYLLSGILIDTLTFFGMLSRLSTTYLGMTVIAMGNALPDSLVTMALAKQGYAIMGMTGAYTGQIFGLLVGLGLALIKTNINTGKSVEFDLFNKNLINENIIMLFVIFSTLGVLIITFIYGIIRKYSFARNLSLILIFIYITIFCIVSGIAIYQAIQGI